MGQPTLAAARAKARRRNRDHIKRAQVSDITADQELAIRRKARDCPLCGIRMRSDGGKPGSKELDHIIPIAVGGTHTHGNVRIICRLCNQRRPKDGSDYSGPVTLWAQGPSPVKRPRKQKTGNVTTCRKGLHPWVAPNITTGPTGKRRCKACDRERQERRDGQRLAPRRRCKCGAPFTAPGATLMCPACTETAGRKAAALHAAGGMNWDQARRLCQCGEAVRRDGRCAACMRSTALRAVTLYTAGWSLRQIGSELGYRSPTGVSNLIKSVSDIEMRIGRPSSLFTSHILQYQ